MSQTVKITNNEIFKQLKLSGKFPELVAGIINRKVIHDTATDLGIDINTEELQQEADRFRLLNKLQTAGATWKWLQENNLTVDDLEEIIANGVIFSKLSQHLFADRVETYFFEHKLDYTGALLYEVILDDEDLGMELFYAIQEEEISFFDVAYQYIEDRELRRRGGYRGKVSRNELKPEISAAVFAAKPPQLLKPIISSQGVHLIRVEDIIEPQLTELLRYQILSELFSQWLEQKTQQLEVIYECDLGSEIA